MNWDQIKNLDVQELVDSIQNLDFENIGGWPTPVKIGASVLLFVAVLVGAYFFAIKPTNAELQQLQNEKKDLVEEFESKSFKAQNVDEYKQQLAEMKKSFGSLLEQLPKDTEVPGLLEDITHTGLGSGLTFKQIALGSETKKEFYAELPINIKVTGEYHGFGSFVSGVASLPRIVTLHDFKVTPTNNDNSGSGGVLQMNITAKTYRYAGGDTGSQNDSASGQ